MKCINCHQSFFITLDRYGHIIPLTFICQKLNKILNVNNGNLSQFHKENTELECLNEEETSLNIKQEKR